VPDIDETLRSTYANLRGAFEGDFDGKAASPDDETGGLDDEATLLPEEGAETVEETPEHGAAATTPEEGDEEHGADPDAAQTKPAVAFKPPWKKAALAEWEKLPALARAEIERRESDFHKGIEQYKAGAASAQEWDRTLQPFMATIKTFNVAPQVAVQELLKADHALRYSAPQNKVGFLLKIAGDYGIDLNTLANGIQQIAGAQVWEQQNPGDPRLQQLQNEIALLKQQQLQAQQQHVQAEASAVDQEIAAFAADPDHEHFPLLQKDMGILMQHGRAQSLDEAYEMAMRQNPQTYQVWLAQQQQGWDAQRKAKVAKAKQAGANNVRPNGRASVPTAAPTRTMEEDIEATARQLGLIN